MRTRVHQPSSPRSIDLTIVIAPTPGMLETKSIVFLHSFAVNSRKIRLREELLDKRTLPLICWLATEVGQNLGSRRHKPDECDVLLTATTDIENYLGSARLKGVTKTGHVYWTLAVSIPTRQRVGLVRLWRPAMMGHGP